MGSASLVIVTAVNRGLVTAGIILVLASNVTAKGYKWYCVYTQRASPEGLVKDDDFKLEFGYDDLTGKAVLIGNNGVADVDVHLGYGSATFMEKLNSGVVQTTTVSKNGVSVHSRHTILRGEMVPTQYYGQCKIQ